MSEKVILTDEETPFGRIEINPKTGTTKYIFLNGIDTRRSIKLRKKYRKQS
tara:strand:- start:11143 stop:11295 length:153 start_codon:yes stop_codon:yes gene_type:complete